MNWDNLRPPFDTGNDQLIVTDVVVDDSHQSDFIWEGGIPACIIRAGLGVLSPIWLTAVTVRIYLAPVYNPSIVTRFVIALLYVLYFNIGRFPDKSSK